jgi:hypothetical protein
VIGSDGLMPVGRGEPTATQVLKDTGQPVRSPNWLRSRALRADKPGVTSDEANTDAVEGLRPVYAVGMEVPVAERTPPEIRPEPVTWEPYRGIQFSVRVRIVISFAVLILPVFLVLAAGVQILAGEGQARVSFVLLLMPVVVIWPVARWALRDLWGRHR